MILLVDSDNLLAQGDFIVKDTSIVYGVKLIKGRSWENAMFITLRNNGVVSKYTPYEVSEFEFSDGLNFKAFNIIENGQSQRYFLELVDNGQIPLYYLKTKTDRRFFVSTHDSLQVIPENRIERSKFLSKVCVNCAHSVENASHVKLTKNSLRVYFKNYQTCSKSYLPRVKYGIKYGLSISKLKASQEEDLLGKVNLDQSIEQLFGTFIDLPLGASNFSFNAGLNIRQFKSTTAFAYNGDDYDLIVDQSRFEAPVLIRYTFLSSKVCPFLQLGLVYSTLLKDNGGLFKYELVGDDIFTNFNDQSFFNKNQLGLSLGSGMILMYNSKFPLVIELSYNKLFKYIGGYQENSLNLNEVVFTVGMMF